MRAWDREKGLDLRHVWEGEFTNIKELSLRQIWWGDGGGTNYSGVGTNISKRRELYESPK